MLAEIDAQGVKSDYIIHFSHSTTSAEKGSCVLASTLSMNFKKNIDLLGLDYGEQTQPTFHEIRSLSERLYREQGVDTKILLGHKSQRQTDLYNDNRSIEYQYLIDF
ncbi:hypothetical protein SAMN02583745_01973 [Thorsellia anophelis DSM 18579]|uniref:Phage integrase family protein n=1 Tax=Thorsellia anophelis DSM 18579 TaxID=1123402 RepID=A0A1I0DH42_9GAMM|nr:hypothetical protein SAMN02583745_01973 [Thorsellia anophelis DSM 18579]